MQSILKFKFLFFIKKYFVWPLLLILVLMPEVNAQFLPSDSAGKTQAVVPVWPEDSLGRRTPRGTVEGFIRAVANENYKRASRYLRSDPALKKKRDGSELAQSLQQLLDQNGHILPYSLINNGLDGQLDDNLGPNLERVGTAKINNESFDLILEKTEGPTGEPIWLFSSQTIQQVPLQTKEAPIAPLIDKLSPKILEENKWNGVPLSHWLGIIGLAILGYLIAWTIVKIILFVIPYLWHKSRTDPTAGILKAFGLPLRIYLAVLIFTAASQQAGISIIVRQQLSVITYLVAVAALLLLLWRLINAISLFIESQLNHRNNLAGVSALLFMRRAAKIALMVVGIIILLDNLGYDVTTGLAALGIGGIALALGAQKTVENFVGSVTLIADQPVRVGDFCKVGDTVGTVEQIGIRSTRIRTLDRTIVTIPNGEFSSQKIENYAHRDRFWFHPTLTLRFETTPDQIRYLLVEIRSLLYAHPNVDPSPARIRFTGLAKDSLNLEIFAYVHAKDFDEFLEIQEDLYLRIMDVVEVSGTGFAFPSQTVYVAPDPGVSTDKANEIGKKVNQWQEAGEMQLPRFTPERIQELKNTITYPPEGSVLHQNGKQVDAI